MFDAELISSGITFSAGSSRSLNSEDVPVLGKKGFPAPFPILGSSLSRSFTMMVFSAVVIDSVKAVPNLAERISGSWIGLSSTPRYVRPW